MGSKKYCRKANRTAKNSAAKPEGQLVLAWREAGAAMDEAGRALLMATFGAVKTTALGLGVCGVLETGKVHDLRLEAHGHPPVRASEQLDHIKPARRRPAQPLFASLERGPAQSTIGTDPSPAVPPAGPNCRRAVRGVRGRRHDRSRAAAGGWGRLSAL